MRINGFAIAARYVPPTLILPFLRQHPQVHIDLFTEGLLTDIVPDGFDLGVRVANLVPTDMIAVPIGRPLPSPRWLHRPISSGTPSRDRRATF